MVRDAVKRDIEALPAELRGSAEAALALRLAELMDDETNSATSRSMCSKELRETLGLLRAKADRHRAPDSLDRRRERIRVVA